MKLLRDALVVLTLAAHAGCGSSDNNKGSIETHTVGGVVTGLAGSGLVLRNNGGDDRTVAQSGTFTFGTAVTSGRPYLVTVSNQPAGPTQTCTVLHGSGTVTGSDITNVAIDCTTNNYSVGGTISGLAGSGLVLLNSGGDSRNLVGNGSFTFATVVASGSMYNVTVSTQPINPRQTCVIANAGGTVGAGDVANVAVTCTTDTYSIGGAIAGLTGSGLTLAYNGSVTLPVVHGGPFTIATGIATGVAYNVTITNQPTDPDQTCVLSRANGAVTEADVDSIEVFCPNAPGSFVLVTNASSSGTVLVYAINATTGELSEVEESPFPAGAGPIDVVITPNGKFAYVANYSDSSSDGSVSAYTIDRTTGVLSAVAGSPFAADGHPGKVAVHPSGNFLYVASTDGVTTYTVDAATGVLAEVAGSQIVATSGSVEFDSTGRFAFVGTSSSVSTYAVNAASGTLELAAGTPYSGGNVPSSGTVVDPFGKFLFGVNDPGVSVLYPPLFAHVLNATTGSLTAVPGSPFLSADPWATRPRSVAVEPRGRFAYVANGGSNNLGVGSVSIFSIDFATGTATALPGGPVGAEPGFRDIVVEPSGKFAYVAANNGAVRGYTINAGTGTLTELPGSPYPTPAAASAVTISR